MSAAEAVRKRHGCRSGHSGRCLTGSLENIFSVVAAMRRAILIKVSYEIAAFFAAIFFVHKSLPETGMKGEIMKNTVFTGAATAIVTPLNEKGIDFEKFGELIEWQIAQGIDAIALER